VTRARTRTPPTSGACTRTASPSGTCSARSARRASSGRETRTNNSEANSPSGSIATRALSGGGCWASKGGRASCLRHARRASMRQPRRFQAVWSGRSSGCATAANGVLIRVCALLSQQGRQDSNLQPRSGAGELSLQLSRLAPSRSPPPSCSGLLIYRWYRRSERLKRDTTALRWRRGEGTETPDRGRGEGSRRAPEGDGDHGRAADDLDDHAARDGGDRGDRTRSRPSATTARGRLSEPSSTVVPHATPQG
jgi:hypothetical protein